ncbi:hypothetical protein CO057_00605 [Candidatus Uhrbacteria bacterium CG_4_9_14_0_2_um_filter_41_50]|uniref:AI-2E family transporter n=1 Tax=Candidatus Uhrbacteria bacterium CG_4_9_14_0_2_um_filter_41_50 TaxID=1975031 RepID=A0A2M8EQ11_9BACT|nr:MAG: hypothetical protein COZ45_02010 [Candidatus Uhrbacteria bacterium CG_4_10_14_3_um_filter_41_21]PIZ54663.1 MAG: hypothetical protein COY24_02950 [Candidatus Uhrbacteria bacterium CG_4_10_14_0_2_um_filter_41_21]PJB84733.1 MAG: hypothetical protein CO086_01925 [Candidatus Uhrbacteria bacterium CG_4_9_14_0_8_um_filter_41_16]PJC24835.1 MAG: hypothetical protein CO057_00605 [Candidatus Uhrbacteria bacterium CG_4_9_14_0_2_um_filter_41_50]PJE75235.1 MAG: hypothetical protein COV03_01195 [Candi
MITPISAIPTRVIITYRIEFCVFIRYNDSTMTTKSQTSVTKWFFLLASAVVLILSWKIIQPFAPVLVAAGIAAIILTPVEKRVKGFIKSERLSALAMLILVLIVIVVPLFTVSVVMVDQAAEIIDTSLQEDSWIRSLNIADNQLILSLPPVVQTEIKNIDVVGLGKNAAEWIFSRLGNLLSSTAKLLFNVVIFMISLYYFLVDREKINQLVQDLSPFKDTLDVSIMKRIVNTVRSVVFGALVIAILKAILAMIGLAIFGVPGSVLWGAMVAVASQIPMIGAALILGPAVAYLFIIGSIGPAIGLLIWSILVVGLVDNFLAPKLVGSKTKMHELLILVSILGGLQVFGPIGFIVGPTILAAVMVVVELYKSGILEDAK